MAQRRSSIRKPRQQGSNHHHEHRYQELRRQRLVEDEMAGGNAEQGCEERQRRQTVCGIALNQPKPDQERDESDPCRLEDQ